MTVFGKEHLVIFAGSQLRVFILAMVAASLAVTGCNAGPSASAAAPPPAPEVSVLTVHSEDTPIYGEYTAQTFARDMVEVRGRVDGYIEKRLFETGTDVQAGQPLYILDLRPYEADVQKVRGELSQSEADKEFAANQVGLLQAEADLSQAQANLLRRSRM
jgi:membrane fusion protein (multidrug efflux system)